jgi:subtilisin-like proprotein convertase family protein/subtilisin family serine protease
MKRVLFLCGVLAAVSCNGREPLTGGDTDQPVALPPETVARIERLLAEKGARTPVQRKISSQLLYLSNGLVSPPSDVLPLSAPDVQGRVLVDIKHRPGASVNTRIQDLGGKLTHASMIHRSARAWMPLDRLEDLAAEAAVLAIRPALQAMNRRGTIGQRRWNARVQALSGALEQVRSTSALPAGAGSGLVASQGDAAHGADRARRRFAADGTGVRIGVLSDSDDFREQSIGTGDLPADAITLPGEGGRPGAGEGTAMMEIVHDLAPGAKLFFASAFNGPESFADNIRALRFQHHCDIIVDDVIYFFESPFQDDIIAQAVEDVVISGGLYFSSAGNEGNLADGTSGTWEGDFKSAGLLGSLADGYLAHDFGEKNVSNRIESDSGPVILHWSDPGTLDEPASGNDYDLFVLTPDLREVALASTDVQDGDDLPFEFLGFFVPTGYRVVVAQHAGAQARALRIATFGELAVGTHGAVWGHAAAPGAFGVGAVNANLGPGGFSNGPTTQVELFSADGNRRVFYNRAGGLIKGPPTFAGNGGEVRKKPDFSAADGVLTTLPPESGLNPFFGTSAAAPHAAAVAALLKSAVPTASQTKLRNALVNGALDIEGDGVDLSSGSGIVSAMNSMEKLGAKPAVLLELSAAVPANPVVPGGTVGLAVTIVNLGGADATNVRGTLTSTTPGVVISRNFSLYPALAAGGGSGTNNTPLVFSLPPSALCGLAIQFRLAVTFTGHGASPTALNFTLQSGTPSTVPLQFSYTGPPVPIPDAIPDGVDIPLAVSGVGAISNVQFSIDGTSCSNAIGSTTVGLDHTWVGDLSMRLTSPQGTPVTLMSRPGTANNSGNNFCGTRLSDLEVVAVQNISLADAPFTGTFRPASPLAAFNGQGGDGTWILNVSDAASVDTGSVRAFSLLVTGFTCGPP